MLVSTLRCACALALEYVLRADCECSRGSNRLQIVCLQANHLNQTTATGTSPQRDKAQTTANARARIMQEFGQANFEAERSQIHSLLFSEAGAVLPMLSSLIDCSQSPMQSAYTTLLSFGSEIWPNR